MKTTQGFLVLGSSSVLFASVKPSTVLAYSITASCIPRQMPRNGTLFSLAYLAASIFPCTPLFPKPPGTRMPSAPWRQNITWKLINGRVHLDIKWEWKNVQTLSNFQAALYASGFCHEGIILLSVSKVSWLEVISIKCSRHTSFFASCSRSLAEIQSMTSFLRLATEVCKSAWSSTHNSYGYEKRLSFVVIVSGIDV